MKMIVFTFVMLVLTAAIVFTLAAKVFAAELPAPDEYGLLAGLFLGFASFIVSVKLIPGIIRFASIIRKDHEESGKKVIPILGRNV